MEEDEIRSHFLKIHLARLTMARLLGFLDRWIKDRIEKSSEEELRTAERDLWEWSRMDGEEKVSLGRRKLKLSSHPLSKTLISERLKRDQKIELLNPSLYLEPLHELSESEIRNYLMWKGETHGSVGEWKKDKRRSLPIIQRTGDQSGRSNPPRNQSSIQTSKGKEARAYSPGAGKKKETV